MDQKIADGVKKILRKVLQVDEIDENVKFSEVYNLDSLSTLELISELENELGIRIPNEAIAKITNFKSTVRTLQELKVKQTAAEKD